MSACGEGIALAVERSHFLLVKRSVDLPGERSICLWYSLSHQLFGDLRHWGSRVLSNCFFCWKSYSCVAWEINQSVKRSIGVSAEASIALSVDYEICQSRDLILCQSWDLSFCLSRDLLLAWQNVKSVALPVQGSIPLSGEISVTVCQKIWGEHSSTLMV